MKYSTTHPSPTVLSLSVTLDQADLAEVRPQTIAKLARTLKVSGFRAGKVPLKIAEKHLENSAIESQLVEDAINKHTIAILDKENASALARPEVDVKTFVPGSELAFEVQVEVLPAVTLGDYKKLKASKETVQVAEAEVKEVLERMRQQFADKTSVTRAVKKGDHVTIDFVGKKDKIAFDGGTANDYELEIGSGSFIPGFEDAIIGHVPNDAFTVPLTFPKDYHAAELKGQKVEFDVTLKKIEAVQLPKLDDEFAVKCGPFAKLADLKADIKKELLARKEQEALERLKDRLLEQLVEKSTVPTPESVVQDQMQIIERDTVQNLMYRGQTLEQFLEVQGVDRDAWLKTDVRPAAERRVKVGLVLAELSKAEKIEVSKKELEARHEEQMKQYTDPSLRQRFDSPEERRNLANRLLTEKTVDRLVELTVA